MSTSPIIAITPGDPCGIGPEVIARAFLNDALTPQAKPLTQACFVAGDVGVMQQAAKLVDPEAQKLQMNKTSYNLYLRKINSYIEEKQIHFQIIPLTIMLLVF